MIVALTGANSDLARYLIPKLKESFQVLSFSRKDPKQYFDFLVAHKVDFKDATFVFHFAHPYSTNEKYLEDALNNLDLMLKKSKVSEVNHILISSLSSYPENTSNYSICKNRLEELFRFHGHGVVRIGIVYESEGVDFQSYGRVRSFLRFLPFRLVNTEATVFFLTEIGILLKCIENIVSSSNANFSREVYSEGPLNFKDFSNVVVKSRRQPFILPLDVEFLKKFLRPISRRFIFFDKILNLVSGMGLRL